MPVSEIIGRTILNFQDRFSEGRAAAIHERDMEFISRSGNEKFQAEILCADGKYRDFVISRAACESEKAGVDCIAEILIDISDRKLSHNALIDMYGEIEDLLSSIDSILIGVSLRDSVAYWNKTAGEIFNIKAEEALGKNINSLGINWDWERVFEGISESILSRNPIILDDVVFRNHEGRDRFIGMTVTPILDRNSELRGFLVYGNDVTDRRIMEMQLLQDQKLKSIGELAAGIAHEINTPTQYINDNINFLQKSFKDIMQLCSLVVQRIRDDRFCDDISLKEELRRISEKLDLEYLEGEIPLAINQSMEGIGRIVQIVKSMRSFAYPERDKRVLLDINKALADTITISRNEWKYDVDIVTDFDPSLPEVLCYPAEINQVFLNIIINAVHAIKDAKKAESIEKGEIALFTKGMEDYAEIRITDNGVGIPEDVLPKIYDPFFTTKEVGRGTGQGLAISHSIVVDKHNGRIVCMSRPGVGTTFYIRLPYNPEKFVEGL